MRLTLGELPASRTLTWRPDTDPLAADVFAFAKSLWAVAANKKYPPQGQLLIRLAEVDLAEFGGRPAEDLARLLELATATRPADRPGMVTMRDELRTWLTLYPGCTVVMG